ncbi:MAG TPA: AraC family transcriptional regulator [Candidimonas sp.]|nr:AraC family transcriptional regulator [Candidimonas sp.]
MSPQTKTVPVRFVTDLIDAVAKKPGFDPGCIRRASIAPALLRQPGARVTIEQFADLYRLLAIQFDDETPGIFSRPLRNGTFKFLCLGMLGAKDLRIALHRFSGFFRLVLDELQFDVSTEDSVTRIALVERTPLGERRVLGLELMLMLVQGVASWLIQRRIPFLRIDLAYPAPAHAADYADLYPGPAYFGQGITALYMSSGLLHEPIRQDKAALATFLRNAPMDWFYVSVSDRPFTHRVKDRLQDSPGAAQTVDTMARHLHLSPRTLARRLAAEGTRFQAIKDGWRRDAAIARLTKSDDPVAAIGASLGFEDPTAFNRAFKEWTGSTPNAYRKRPRGTILS